jgi:UDP-N-acetylglucosamine--N-acetylmuramyl-(pentapeptide) pyrophosphoryl-undecaprenol N-acetylglucosamine transferase
LIQAFRELLNMKVVISGGGTGGHIFPGIAVSRKLAEGGNHILFICSKRGIWDQILKKEGFSVRQINVCGFRRNPLSFSNIKFFWLLFVAFIKSVFYLLQFRPQVVIGFGGYASFPIILAAWSLRIPVLLHEQNLVCGLANRILSRLARKIAITYENTKADLPDHKVVLTGNPVRSDIGTISKDAGCEHFGFDKKVPIVLVVGGSQGAHSINEGMVECLRILEASRFPLQVLFITGSRDYEDVCEKLREISLRVEIRAFVHEIAFAYGACDLVICRAGSTTLAEITACGLPSIIVPYPYSTDAHQLKNALFLQDRGASRVIVEEDLTGERLAREIKDILGQEETLRDMSLKAADLARRDACFNLTELIYSLGEACCVR